MITEVVCFPLREIKTLQREEALKKTLNLLTEQEGFESAYWSWQEEDPDIFWVLVDWASIEAHQNLQKRDYYKPFVDDLDQVANVSRLQAFHAHLSPYSGVKALSESRSIVIEICTIHFPADYSPSGQKESEQNLLKFVAMLEEKVPAFKGFTGGWAVEKVPMPVTSEETTVFFGCLGWQSVEAHLAFRETQLFQENRHLLEQAKDLKHVHMVHVSGTHVGKNGHF